MSSDPSYPAFPVVALLGFVLVLVPLPWHLQAWNSGTCLYMFWTALSCLNYGVNSILWRDTVANFAPVWCDISSRIIVASAVAIPAASLCINRRLYCIATMTSVNISRADKRRTIIIDLSIGLGIPLLQLVCQYVVSGHRFDIFEGIGCYPFTYNTIAAYPLSVLWPLVIGLVSAVFCVLTLRAFFRRRAEFASLLTANASLTTNRYFRLMALASVELLCTVPISSYGLSLNLSAAPLYPWISWSNVHYDYSQVDQYPAVVWRSSSNSLIAFGLSTWLAPFCALVFFAFFGFSSEARRNYSKVVALLVKLYRTRCKKCSRSPAILWPSEELGAKTKSLDILPSFISSLSLKSTADSSVNECDCTLPDSEKLPAVEVQSPLYLS